MSERVQSWSLQGFDFSIHSVEQTNLETNFDFSRPGGLRQRKSLK